MVDPGPSGARQYAPGSHRHHCRQSLRSTGPAVGVNTSAPGTRSAGSASGIVGGVDGALGDGDVPGVGDERGEVLVRHLVPVELEVGDRSFVHRPLVGIELVGAHQERAARDAHHVVGHVVHATGAPLLRSRRVLSSGRRTARGGDQKLPMPLPISEMPITSSSTAMMTAFSCASQTRSASSGPRSLSAATRYPTTGMRTVDAAITA